MIENDLQKRCAVKEQRLSNVTENYLTRYREILECMIDEMEAAINNSSGACSISYGFIVAMIPHHRAAVEMSENLLKYTTFIPLEDLAGNIIKSQLKGISEMRSMMRCCSAICNTDEQVRAYRSELKNIANEMFHSMETAPISNSINVNFMREMIPHHLGAVRMSRSALKYPLCQELVPMLEDIIRTQSAEIIEMERLLRRYREC